MVLDSFVHLFDVVVRIFRVWEIHTHHINATAVDQDRCFDGALIDVIGVTRNGTSQSTLHCGDGLAGPGVRPSGRTSLYGPSTEATVRSSNHTAKHKVVHQ